MTLKKSLGNKFAFDCLPFEGLSFLLLKDSMVVEQNLKEVVPNSNTPGTRGWSRLRDQTLAVAINHVKISFFL